MAAGLPKGRSGNLETGHLTLGAGRLFKTNSGFRQAVGAGGLKENEAVNYGFEAARSHGGDIHVIAYAVGTELTGIWTKGLQCS